MHKKDWMPGGRRVRPGKEPEMPQDTESDLDCDDQPPPTRVDGLYSMYIK